MKAAAQSRPDRGGSDRQRERENARKKREAAAARLRHAPAEKKTSEGRRDALRGRPRRRPSGRAMTTPACPATVICAQRREGGRDFLARAARGEACARPAPCERGERWARADRRPRIYRPMMAALDWTWESHRSPLASPALHVFDIAPASLRHRSHLIARSLSCHHRQRRSPTRLLNESLSLPSCTRTRGISERPS